MPAWIRNLIAAFRELGTVRVRYGKLAGRPPRGLLCPICGFEAEPEQFLEPDERWWGEDAKYEDLICPSCGHDVPTQATDSRPMVPGGA